MMSSEEKSARESVPKKAQKGSWWKSTGLLDEEKNVEKQPTPPKKDVSSSVGKKSIPTKNKVSEKTDNSAENKSGKSRQKARVKPDGGTSEKKEDKRKRGSAPVQQKTQRSTRQKLANRGRQNNNRYNRYKNRRGVVSRSVAAEKNEPNLIAQKLRNPAFRRLLARNRQTLFADKQQREPGRVRPSFTNGLPYGKLLALHKPPLTALNTLQSSDSKVQTVETALVVQTEDTQKLPVVKEQKPEEPKPVSKLLINAEEPEECRLALLENGRLESLKVSTINSNQTKNNIYKARIVAVEPNLQAAFVDYGTEKNGFLPFSEIHQEYFKSNLSEEIRTLVEKKQWKKLSITDVVEKGQEVLAQVVKEEVGTKGANMTTYLSLPGRCVVLMPGSDSTGISRRISGVEKRRELREFMQSMDIPEGIGWIVRTASIDITENALSRDVEYLLRLWEETRKKAQEVKGVGMVYEDHHAVLRFLREYFDPSIEEILVDDKTALEQVKDFIELLPRSQRDVKVRLHKGSKPIFNQFSVEDQIESIYQPKVNLPSGGSIVIDPTEALVAIDVNSGSTSKSRNFEASIFQANMEAAAELARQLRLRDLGGLIVVDFIDMRSSKNIREVEKKVKESMKRDKAKVDFSRISKFGLMQISRQKLGSPVAAGNYRVCEHCKGRGMIKSVESLALFYLRRIQTGASRKNIKQVECRFPLDVAGYLLNNKRQELHELEKKYNTEILVVADSSYKPGQHEIVLNKY